MNIMSPGTPINTSIAIKPLLNQYNYVYDCIIINFSTIIDTTVEQQCHLNPEMSCFHVVPHYDHWGAVYTDDSSPAGWKQKQKTAW